MSPEEKLGIARTRLSQQLGFIDRACRDYDDGHKDAALQVAGACRVLFHNTKRQTCLLSAMNWDDVELLSTSPPVKGFIGGGLSSIAVDLMDASKAYQRPMLDGFPDRHHLLRWDRWWTERVYPKQFESLDRMTIITTAADKEFAHADFTLPPAYERLNSGFWEVVGRDGTTRKLAQVQLADLRQIGFEIMNSPSIQSLAG